MFPTNMPWPMTVTKAGQNVSNLKTWTKNIKVQTLFFLSKFFCWHDFYKFLLNAQKMMSVRKASGNDISKDNDNHNPLRTWSGTFITGHFAALGWR
jgi:hypothetical protein